MALRLILIILGIILVVNLILIITGAVMNINIYEKYGKTIFKWFGIFILFVISVYVALSVFALH